MRTTPPTPRPFLDWYGVWASHRKEESDGTVWSQDPPRGVCLRIEPARSSPLLLRPERPWEEGAQLGLITVLHEGGRYRLWYGADPQGDARGYRVCYAESHDGFSWQRPELGLVEYGGSTRSNILCVGQGLHLGAVFVDPSAPPEERYKAVEAVGRYHRDGQHDPQLDRARFK
ncbi:MAG: hypothetical protein AB1505_33135 [Candidatus Latescibacterota bacterium]